MITIIIFYPEDPTHITREEMQEICEHMTTFPSLRCLPSNVMVGGSPLVVFSMINQRSLPVLVWNDIPRAQVEVKEIRARVKQALTTVLRELGKYGWEDAITVRVL